MADTPECPYCGGNPSGSATFELSCCPLAYRDTVEAALKDAKAQIAKLAEDCLRAGVVPERVSRLDSILEDLKIIIEWAKENDRATGSN